MKMKKIALIIAAMGVAGAVQAQGQVNTSYLGLSHTENYTLPSKANSLESLMSNKIQETGEIMKKSQISDMRRAALIEVAQNLGTTNGLQFRMEQKQAEVNAQAKEFDAMFDFTKLTIENGVMAPVIEEGQANYAQNGTDEINVSDKIYRIVEPAKFVSVYPNWRSYLIFSYPTHEMPPSSFLPQNDAEKAVWDEAIKKGWERGVKQAEEIYNASYARLVRDYKGMTLYKLLLAQGLITPTTVAGVNLGVTGGGNEMSINNQIFRITDHSALNPNTGDWSVKYPVTNNVDGMLK